MNEYIGEVLLVIVLVVLNGYFAAAEIALVSARRVTLKAEADEGSTRAAAVLRLTADPSRFLAATQVGITLVGFGASATAAATLATPVARALDGLGVPWITRISGGLAVLLVTLLISYLTLVFGELAPKRLGLQRAEGVAKAVAGPVSLLATVTSPIIWLLSHSTGGVARLIGVKPGAARPGITEEEIKLLVTEQGTLLDEEKRMIHEIFELGDTVAREIMVPRVDMVMLEDTASLGEAIELFRSTGFSRLPVFHDSADSIAGIVMLKDLVGPAAAGMLDAPVADLARRAVFVPESKPIISILSEMRAAHNHIAIVVDEYGGTEGLVTIEDVVEEITGDIADEFDKEHRYITLIGPGEWMVQAQLSVDEARERLGIDVPDSEEYETLAGWVLMELGHIPAAGEVIVQDGFSVRVDLVVRRRIERLRVSRRQPKGSAADGS